MSRFLLTLALSSACAVAHAQPPGPAGDAGPVAPEPADDAGPDAAEPLDETEAQTARPAGEEPVEEAPAEAGATADAPPPEPEDSPMVELRDEDEGLTLSVGGRAGFVHQPDQWVAGPHLALRGIFADFVGVDVTVLAGMATEHWTLRISAHLSLTISAGDFRFYPLVGPAAFIWEPRGTFAEWCDKLQLDACSDSAFGMELGLGAGWRALGIEAYLSTGELPLLTVVGSVTVDL